MTMLQAARLCFEDEHRVVYTFLFTVTIKIGDLKSTFFSGLRNLSQTQDTYYTFIIC